MKNGNLTKKSVINLADCPIHIKENLKEIYNQAIFSTQNSALLERYAKLWSISQNNTKLTFENIQGEEYVLVVAWTSDIYYEERIGQKLTTPIYQRDMRLAGHLWVTPCPQVYEFAQNYLNLSSECLTLRLEQYLGLKPDYGATKFVEIWVKPKDLIRPCPDLEINDSICELTFRNDEERIKFYEAIEEETKGFPWTRLGYTYDWGNKNSYIGACEFLIKRGAQYIIRSVTDTVQYTRKREVIATRDLPRYRGDECR